MGEQTGESGEERSTRWERRRFALGQAGLECALLQEAQQRAHLLAPLHELPAAWNGPSPVHHLDVGGVLIEGTQLAAQR